jgi:predicted  nucleic acid-binding Zn-ribbon protein
MRREARTRAAVAGALAARSGVASADAGAIANLNADADADVLALQREAADLRQRLSRAETALSAARRRDTVARTADERILALEREALRLRDASTDAARLRADCAHLASAADAWRAALAAGRAAAAAALAPVPGVAAGATVSSTPARPRLSTLTPRRVGAAGTPGRLAAADADAAAAEALALSSGSGAGDGVGDDPDDVDSGPEDLSVLLQRLSAALRHERASGASARRQFASAAAALSDTQTQLAAAEAAARAASERAARLEAHLASERGRAGVLKETCEARGELLQSFLAEERQFGAAVATPRKPAAAAKPAAMSDVAAGTNAGTTDADSEAAAAAHAMGLSAHSAHVNQLEHELAAARARTETLEARVAAAEADAAAARVGSERAEAEAARLSAALERVQRQRTGTAAAVAESGESSDAEDLVGARIFSMKKHLESFRRDADTAALAELRRCVATVADAVAAANADTDGGSGSNKGAAAAAAEEDNSFGLLEADALERANRDFAGAADAVARGVLGLHGGRANAPGAAAAAPAAVAEAAVAALQRLRTAAATAVGDAASAGARAMAAESEAATARGELDRLMKYVKERWDNAQSRVKEMLGYAVEVNEAKKRVTFKAGYVRTLIILRFVVVFYLGLIFFITCSYTRQFPFTLSSSCVAMSKLWSTPRQHRRSRVPTPFLRRCRQISAR